MFPEPEDRLWGYDASPVLDLAAKVKARYSELRDPAAEAMMDFDDRDLVRFAHAAGFERIHLELHVDVEPGAHMRAVDLATLLDISPNPLAPTMREALDAALSPSEQERFLAHFEREVADGTPVRRTAVAFLGAAKAG
jgi:hypothetical protein